jgi:hypothetical protein
VTPVIVHPRVSKKLREIGGDALAEAEKRLTQLSNEFGKPHVHSGLGIRKLGRKSYEVRVWLQWRIVMVHHEGRLLADDILNHDGVRLWLKNRGKT